MVVVSCVSKAGSISKHDDINSCREILNPDVHGHLPCRTGTKGCCGISMSSIHNGGINLCHGHPGIRQAKVDWDVIYRLPSRIGDPHSQRYGLPR
jgi:hypothetical protein